MSLAVQSSGLSSGAMSVADEGQSAREDQPVAPSTSATSAGGERIGWKFLREKKPSITGAGTGDGIPPSIPSLAVQVKRLAVLEVKIAARLRRKSFAHHDCVSVLSNLADSTGVSKKTFSVNLKSGASAISNADSQGGGDGKSNNLVLSTPHFRNEVGDDLRACSVGDLRSVGEGGRLIFSPASCAGILMEDYDVAKMDDDEKKRYGYCQLGFWRPQGGHQNKDRTHNRFNHLDLGVLYYRKYFAEFSHQNYFGIDEGLGPVAVSIRKECTMTRRCSSDDSLTSTPGNTRALYRVIVRTAHPNVLRGSVSEESVLAFTGKPKTLSASASVPAKDIISFIAPEVQLGCLRQAQSTSKVTEQLMKLDESGLSQQFKFGVMYCMAGQNSEEEMYNNVTGSEEFHKFMSCIAEKVELKGFSQYRAQLDNKTDSTGTHSYYTQFEGAEIMFHVSTMLPATPNNKQQLLRKRHIGNDIVTIIFQEKGALPFTPATIRSHFQHIFAVVQVLDPCPATGKPQYQVAISQVEDIPYYGPQLPEGGLFEQGADLRDFLLTKLINSECASRDCIKFLNMEQRTRYEYLNDLADNYTTQTTVDQGDSGGLYGKLARMRKRSEKATGSQSLLISNADLCELPGALMWSVQVVDWGIGEEAEFVECLLCISLKYLCLVDEELQTVRMFLPTNLIIGWCVDDLNIHIYYGQGAYVVLNLCNVDEQGEECLSEIQNRLVSAAPNGCESIRVYMERTPGGHLGFMIHRGGIVGSVDMNGTAHAANVREGARIVEMDGIPIYGRLHYYVVGHLKKAQSITAIVIPPGPEGCVRGGKIQSQCDTNNRTGQRRSVVVPRSSRAPQRTPSRLSNKSRLNPDRRGSRQSIASLTDKDAEDLLNVTERAKIAIDGHEPQPQDENDSQDAEAETDV